MQAIIQQLQQQLARIDDELEPKGYSLLEACPFIVATPDGMYTVGANALNQATIEIGNFEPTQFGSRAAEDLVKNFKPRNGHGLLTLVKMSRLDYIQIRKANLEQALTVLGSTVGH